MFAKVIVKYDAQQWVKFRPSMLAAFFAGGIIIGV